MPDHLYEIGDGKVAYETFQKLMDPDHEFPHKWDELRDYQQEKWENYAKELLSRLEDV